MSSPERRRLLERRAAEVEAWVARDAGADSDPESVETERRRNWLEAARQFDPEASLREELTVRLLGASAEAGEFLFAVGDSLLKPLQDSVSAVAGEEVQLAVTGLSRGSTVLHVRAVGAAEPPLDSEGSVPVDSSRADLAMRSMLDLVKTVEEEGDVRRWGSALDSLEKVVTALNRHDLVMGLEWFALNGEARSASLTARGRAYFAQLAETSPEIKELAIAGRVTELRESGVFKVKTGPTKKSPAYEVRVPSEELLGMHLELGQTVHVLVAEQSETDRMGRVKSTVYSLIRHIGQEDEFQL